MKWGTSSAVPFTKYAREIMQQTIALQRYCGKKHKM